MWPGSLWGELWYKGKPIFESHPPWDSINASSKGRSMLPHFLCFLRKSWSELTLHSCGQRPTFLPNQLSPPEPKRLFFDSLCSIFPPFSWFPVLQTVSLAWVCLRHIHSLLHSNFLSWKYPTFGRLMCRAFVYPHCQKSHMLKLGTSQMMRVLTVSLFPSLTEMCRTEIRRVSCWK